MGQSAKITNNKHQIPYKSQITISNDQNPFTHTGWHGFVVLSSATRLIKAETVPTGVDSYEFIGGFVLVLVLVLEASEPLAVSRTRTSTTTSTIYIL